MRRYLAGQRHENTIQTISFNVQTVLRTSAGTESLLGTTAEPCYQIWRSRGCSWVVHSSELKLDKCVKLRTTTAHAWKNGQTFTILSVCFANRPVLYLLVQQISQSTESRLPNSGSRFHVLRSSYRGLSYISQTADHSPSLARRPGSNTVNRL